MKIETKHSLGDHIYIVCVKRQSVQMPCETCDGYGSIELKDKKYRCPECFGNPQKTVYTGKEEYYIAHDGRIGSIQTEHQDGCPPKIQYMIDTTGVGSGSLWPEELTFATMKEALDYCIAHNETEDK